MTAPFGRRLCEVTENRASGGYRLFSLIDKEGPEPQPGQFYMLASEQRWEQRLQRPFLPRALSVAESGPAAGDVRLDFLHRGHRPRHRSPLRAGERRAGSGSTARSATAFSPPRDLSAGAAGAILVGGGIGIAPLALLRRTFAAMNIPTRVLLGFRDEIHSGGLDELFSCCEVRSRQR